MRALVRIRPLVGEERHLVIDGERFVQADGRVDREIETEGLWALPGLADCHCHLAADTLDDMSKPARFPQVRTRAFAEVTAGVFLVADKGWMDAVALRVVGIPPRRRPDFVGAGRIITSHGGYYPGFGVETDEAGLAAAVAAALPAQGWVKLIGDWPRKGVGAVTNFPEAALAVAARVAHAGGARIAIHTMAPETPGMAVRAGIDSIEHGLFLTEPDLDLLGARGGAWVPTVNCVAGLIERIGPERSGGKLLQQGLANIRDLIGSAPGRGVAVLAGTDLALPHGEVAKEAIDLGAAGLSPEAAVASVSTAAYDYLGVSPGLVAGAPADAVFFDRDPREDLRVLTRPVLVLRHGRVLAAAPSETTG
ncbi:MAG TPA: amidohydrolase family protein [Acidimicrobiia bacterium]